MKWIKGSLFVAAAFLLVSVGGGILTKMQPEKELPEGWTLIRPPGETYAMLIDGNDVWTGGQEGVYRIDRLEHTLIEKLSLPREVDYVKALNIDQEGALWIGHFNGLTILKNNSYLTLGEEEGLPDHRVNCFHVNSEENLMVGTWGGVAIYDGNKWETITSQDGLMVDMVNVIFEDSTGGYWFGHYLAPRGGISYLREGNWQYFSVDNGLPHNNITSFYEDDAGYIWVGTGLFERGGAARFVPDDHGQWVMDTVLSKNEGLAGEKVRYIFQDQRGIYWITSEFDGIAVFTKEALYSGEASRILTEECGLANYEVKNVQQDVDGSIWLGTHYGVNVLEAAALQRIP